MLVQNFVHNLLNDIVNLIFQINLVLYSDNFVQAAFAQNEERKKLSEVLIIGTFADLLN